MRGTVIGLLLATGVAGAANAAPFEAVDGTREIIILVDQASISRTGGLVEAEFLFVANNKKPILTRLRFDCTVRTSQPRWTRTVTGDLTLTPANPATGEPRPIVAGTLVGSLLERVCFSRKAKPSAGWTEPNLGEAIKAARGVLTRLGATPG